MDFTDTKQKMNQAIENLKTNLQKVRVGVINELIFSGIYVEYCNSKTPITQVASFTKIDGLTMKITPWDGVLVRKIMKAISLSQLGVNPSTDGNCIIVQFPPVTYDKREALAKNAKAIGERSKVAIREIRKDANQKFKKLLNNPLAPEFLKGLQEVQKMTDDFIKLVDEEVKQKENEIKGHKGVLNAVIQK